MFSLSLCGCFVLFFNVLISSCWYFYFDSYIDDRDVHIYFERWCNIYFQAIALFVLVFDVKNDLTSIVFK